MRSGREVRYRRADPEIVEACGLMRQVLIRRIACLGDMAASYSSQAGSTGQTENAAR